MADDGFDDENDPIWTTLPEVKPPKGAADLMVPADSHLRLTQDLLPKALAAIEQVLDAPMPVGEDGMPDPRLSLRMLSLKARTATATANMVIHLGDGSLRRQAGSKLDEILDLIKREKPDLFRPVTVIDQKLDEP